MRLGRLLLGELQPHRAVGVDVVQDRDQLAVGQDEGKKVRGVVDLPVGPTGEDDRRRPSAAGLSGPDLDDGGLAVEVVGAHLYAPVGVQTQGDVPPRAGCRRQQRLVGAGEIGLLQQLVTFQAESEVHLQAGAAEAGDGVL